MKLLFGLAIVSHFSNASAACGENTRRKHCLADADCQWLRDTRGSKNGGRNGTCVSDDANLSCASIVNNKKLCYARGCQFNWDTKDCSDAIPCSDISKRKSCAKLDGIAQYGCFWDNQAKLCTGGEHRDTCSYFDSWKWGCHNVASGDCVYTGTCNDRADVSCSDFAGERTRCRKFSDDCAWEKETGTCISTVPTTPAPTTPAPTTPAPTTPAPTAAPGRANGAVCYRDSDCASNNCVRGIFYSVCRA